MDHITLLYQKFLNRQCSPDETEYLLRYFQQCSDSEVLITLIQAQLDSGIELTPSAVDHDVIARNRSKLQQNITPPTRRLVLHSQMWAIVAATVLVLLSVSLYYAVYKKQPSADVVLTSRYGADVSPGYKRAYIRLSTGQQIQLDSTQTGLMTSDGQYTYSDGTQLLDDPSAHFVTIYTPVGGEYHLTLPDGTKAWLNAASSLTYPSRFDHAERIIETTGEVYLEVETDTSRPFIVKTGKQRIQVLGTAFNIRSYTSPYITTLLHGKIALEDTESKQKVRLQAGEQSTFEAGAIAVQQVADASDYASWREGVITNKDATLQETCQEIERWYGVKFIYPAGFKNNELALNMLNREENLSLVLEMLKNTYRVDFEIKGKEVIVR